MGGILISWKSKKQTVVSKSSAEAEYRVMTIITCELMWLKQLIEELGVTQVKSMQLICDNQATLHIAFNPMFHERTKHFEIDYHFVREKVLSGKVFTIFVGSND